MNPLQLHLPPHLQHLKGEELHAAIKKEYNDQAIAFILRQTDYTEEIAIEKLDVLKDPMKVVKEYLGGGASKLPEPESSSNSKNKMKYGEIRKFMDAGARKYNMQKEFNEQRRKYQEYIEQQQQQQRQIQEQQQQQIQEQQPEQIQEQQQQQEHQPEQNQTST